MGVRREGVEERGDEGVKRGSGDVKGGCGGRGKKICV